MSKIIVNDVEITLRERKHRVNNNYMMQLKDIIEHPSDYQEEYHVNCTLAQLKTLGECIVAFCQAEEKNAGT